MSACEALLIAYARHVDFKEYDQFAALFTQEDSLNACGPLSARAAIQTAMVKHPNELRSRHVLTNIYVDAIDDNNAAGITYRTLYRHMGEESLIEDPVSFDGPAAIGHYKDEYTLTLEGWRIACRELEFAFQNPTADDNACYTANIAVNAAPIVPRQRLWNRYSTGLKERFCSS
ncbi:MAG: nuclear transport factor 2 family protein [Gammaproteobacteria bacterium]|nr:nuclear transport factor 2 family protein [Gammaproteobacteria bacterium]